MQAMLSEKTKWTKVKDYSSADTADVTATGVDMKGYRGVMFITSYGTAAADNLLHVEQSADDSTYNDVADTEVNVSTSDEDQWVDVYKPGDRYVRVVCERGTSSTLESIWAVQYDPLSIPQDNTVAGTIHGERHVSPAEGTI